MNLLYVHNSHVVTICIKKFQHNHIPLLEFHRNSAYLNLIENLWKRIKIFGSEKQLAINPD